MNIRGILAIFSYYFLVFFVGYLLCGLFFVFIVRPFQWWLLAKTPYEGPTIDFLIQNVKALGIGAFISSVGMFIYQKMQSRR